MNVGSTVVDERLYQSITLRNTGALGTNYRLIKTSLLQSEQTKTNSAVDTRKDTTPGLETEKSVVSGLI